MNSTKPVYSISKDERVLHFHAGTSHDWLRVATREDGEALIAEYDLQVKYPVSPTVRGGFEFAIF